jgi:ketosteroid isomerase-like protein
MNHSSTHTGGTVMHTARSIFQKVDTMDPHALDEVIAEDARMVFGNAEPLVGREAIAAGAGAFLSTFKGLRHRILNEWSVGADTIVETEVTYTRLDGKEVSLPAVSIWRVGDDGLIAEYRVFFDVAPIYAP